MLGVPAPIEKLTKLLRTFYVLHADHGGGNMSTFSGKAVASGHADQFSSLTAAMAACTAPFWTRQSGVPELRQDRWYNRPDDRTIRP